MTEEAWRLGEQKNAQIKTEKAKLAREIKENQETQRINLENSLRKEKSIKMKNNIFY